MCTCLRICSSHSVQRHIGIRSDQDSPYEGSNREQTRWIHWFSFCPRQVSWSKYFQHIHPSHIRRSCQTTGINVVKVIAMDYIPQLWRKCIPTFSELIAKQANVSFSEGHFPSHFKKAIVTPLLTKRDLDAENLANYRPISNLNTISKMIERLVLVRIHHHIIQSPNYNIPQSAYQKHHSTQTALLRILNDT